MAINSNSAPDQSRCEICPYIGPNEPGRLFATDHWQVTLASDQAYLGRAIVSARRHVGSLSDLTPDEWRDLHTVITRYEAALKGGFGATLFNWNCLMNNAYKLENPKPHVHWHVRPRYESAVEAAGQTYKDPNFAHHYERDVSRLVDDETREQIAELIKSVSS